MKLTDKKLLLISFSAAVLILLGANSYAAVLADIGRYARYLMASVSDTVAPSNPKLECMREVVERRESSLLEKWNNYAERIKAAREKRREGLALGWTMESKKERESHNTKVWNEYKKEARLAKQEFKKATEAVWKEFEKEAKKCNAARKDTVNPGEETE